ncbi:MAG: radical SAM peptide maturase [Prevotellaceae bacterium]|jgi:uncharacterized protein|nr:radical SAM peptide maturase [Prevotellaceae bacterium]
MDYLKPKYIEYQIANLKQLTFEVTDACNLKCTYCGYGEFYGDYDTRENKMLPTEKAFIVIDYLVNYWNSSLNSSSNNVIFISFYGGEPLLNMKFIETVVSYIRKQKCRNRTFTFSMTTNALLLHKYMDFLKENDFYLLISLDGDKENTAYRIDKSGKPAFDHIIYNTDKLRNKYPDYFTERVNFNAVLHNKNSVADIYNYIKNKYDKIPSIGELNNMGIKPEMESIFMQTYRNAQESLYQSENYSEIEKDMFMQIGSYQSVTAFIHQYSGFVYKDYNELLYGKNITKTIPTGACIPFSRKMYVTVNGKILPCERIGHQFAIGEITENEVILDFEGIAEKYNGYYAKLDKQCSKCHNQLACKQCIFNLADLEKRPTCYGYMGAKDFETYKATQIRFLEENPEAYYEIMEKVIIR